ncbi:CvpA family protein [Thermoactinomyces sp. DSM 45892]|uniref:CvpA family protein n=1 Tax=Thermoactinomyces sp. DSM 45892 TaxID=1882753 RepID=UPI000B84CF65|nr:CvpA family protein [Thermoactinomyces sp. DSM 45892]
MNWIDMILLLAITAACFQGYRQGLVRQVFALLGTIVSIYLAYKLSGPFAQTISGWFPGIVPETGVWGLFPVSNFVYSFLAFVVIFLVARAIFRLIGGVAGNIAKIPVLSAVNQTGGLVFGFLRMAILLVLVVNVFSFVPVPNVHNKVQDSFLSQQILAITPDLKDEVIELFKGKSP